MTENKNNEISTLKTLNTLNKKDEIKNITEELKSHYYKNEFFVDPDKKFMNLIQRITVRNLFMN
jgi:pyridoxine 5'-phosphate synthase PdxJ